jgi:hypothetical protein
MIGNELRPCAENDQRQKRSEGNLASLSVWRRGTAYSSCHPPDRWASEPQALRLPRRLKPRLAAMGNWLPRDRAAPEFLAVPECTRWSFTKGYRPMPKEEMGRNQAVCPVTGDGITHLSKDSSGCAGRGRCHFLHHPKSRSASFGNRCNGLDASG